MDTKPNITDFSHELLCHILRYLPLREILSVAMLCKKMLAAVNMHLQLCKSIDFCQDSIFGYMPSTITDDHLLTLLKKCPHLETVYGLHPVKIERRRLRKRAALTIPGIIEALSLCFHLKAIETSDLRLFEAIMQHLPQLEIIGHFQNRNGLFPPQASQRLKLQPYPRISSLHLIGVEVPELTAMPHLQHLHLQCVRFTKLQPFRAFLAQSLKSFVMKHCIGPSVPQRYLSLIIALSSSPNLSHLELVRVPLLNGLFQRAVEDSYRHSGFVNLRTLVISGCKGILEADLGHLMIVASKNLETLYIQPSLTKDSLFVSLSFAQCSFPVLRNLHLGYIDNLNSSGEWSNDALLSFGLAEVPDTPSSLTDSGMKVISQLFPNIKTLSVSNCPHLMVMYQWMAEEDLEAWSRLTDLTLQKCHCLQLSSFVLFISFLPIVQVVILNDMFREPPKGCSHVGLSAGTGLGMSSAVVSNQDEHIAVQGHHQEFEPPGDEENEEIEREFIDGENEDNPEPQFMVLQRDFFDGEHNEEAVGNPPLENEQDPTVENQELNVVDNEVHNSSLHNENIVISNESILEDSRSSPAPVNDKYVSSEAYINENQSHSVCPSKYCLRNSNKIIKSSQTDCMQRNISSNDDGYSTSNIKNEVCDEDYNSKNNGKISTVSENLYEYDYDPHKPSTSKAGSHLDYSDGYNDYKCSKTTKRLNKCSDGQDFNKKQKKSLKVTKNVTVDEKVEKDCNTFSQSNTLENDINNYSDFKEEGYSNCIKEKLSENSFYTQKSSNIRPVSIKSDEIPANMRCYVVIEKIDIKSNKFKIVSPAENKKDDKTTKVDNPSKRLPCCDCFDDVEYKNKLNESCSNNCEKDTHIKPLKRHDNDIYSKKHYPSLEYKDECLHLDTNRHNGTSKAKATSSDNIPNITDICIKENTCNTSNSKTKRNASVNCPLIDFTLPEKKLDNNVKELSKHDEILLDHSCMLQSEDTMYEAEINLILESDKTKINADILNSPLGEKTCNSVTIHNSVSTVTCAHNCNDSDVNNVPENETETSFVHDSTSASLDVIENDLHKSEENLFVKAKTFQEISKNFKHNDSPESSKIIKPCSVLITKIENIDTHFTKYVDGESININENSAELHHSHNLEKATLTKNPNIHDYSQPSTSGSRTDISDNSNRHSRNYKKMHSSKYFKKGKSSVITRSKNVNFSTTKPSSKNEVKECSVPEMQNIKNNTESNSHTDLSKCKAELFSPNTKKMRKIYPSDNDPDEDTKFYVSVPNNGPVKIINSITGESYQTPNCHVVVTQMSNENSDNFQKKSKCKNKHEKCQKSFTGRCDTNFEFNTDLPSTSKTEKDLNKVSESVYLNKYQMYKKEQNHIQCNKCKNLIECCCKYSVSPNLNSKRLCINNADARILLKQCNSEESSKSDTHNQLSCQFDFKDKIYDNEVYSSSEQKIKNEPIAESTSENPSYENKINGNVLGNDESSSSSEEKADNFVPCNPRKRRRKVITFLKRVKKPCCDSKIKTDLSRDSAKNNTKRMSSVPMISLINQGTQATSADIRRSVRRIRRAAAQRRTVPPAYTSKGRYSSKISAKILIKRPKSMIPRPESHDKATSTSDPLLEDDAVQTLQLSSSTLLSFTVVSCGISDLIIDRCPKLIHIEVQACRILKRFQFNNSPMIRRLNVSQCPKLNICALAAPVMSLSTDSYFLVSYEPCMQGYHPGEGEKAILSKASVNQSVLILHDVCDISYDGIQAKFREKILEWLHFLSQLHLYLNYSQEKVKKNKYKSEVYQFSEYPWSHDLQRIHGHYSYSSSSDFCGAEGRYQLLTNNPIFCDIFETCQLDSGFPDVKTCAAFKDPSLISCEVIEKYLEMQKKFVAIYIPVTENNQVNF